MAFTLNTATVNAAGTSIAVTFTGIDLAPLLPATGVTGFTVKVNTVARTVSSATASGSTVTLNLATPVVMGDTVTVSYAPGNLTDSSGTPETLTAFTDQAATNSATKFGLGTATVAAAGSEVVLTFPNATTNVSPATGITGFTVKVGGVLRTIRSATRSATKTVTLKLVGFVGADKTVTVSYSGGNLVDTAGSPNSLATLTNEAVTNNSTQQIAGREIVLSTPKILIKVNGGSATEISGGTSEDLTDALADRSESDVVRYLYKQKNNGASFPVNVAAGYAELTFTVDETIGTDVELWYTLNGRTPRAGESNKRIAAEVTEKRFRSALYDPSNPPRLYQNSNGQNTVIKVRAFAKHSVNTTNEKKVNTNVVSKIVKAEVKVYGAGTGNNTYL
jgi:uncharacterized repeat protein (TIGR02059 family)